MFARARPGLEPGEGETGETDEERRDAVLDVVMARAGFVAREEGREGLRWLDPVDDRNDDQRDADHDGGGDEGARARVHLLSSSDGRATADNRGRCSTC